MGGSSSRASTDASCANAFQDAMQHLQIIQGGGDCACAQGGFFGGAIDDVEGIQKELREYESSLSGKAKEDVIRRLARAMARAGIAVNPDGDLDQIVSELVKQLPNPKHGKTFAASAEAQQKVCRVIADVLNDEFTPGASKPSEKLIDTSLSAVEMCRHVGEWAHSFSTGVNTEFMAVHASVKNAMRQLDVLEEVMSEAMRKIRARVEKTGDGEQSRDLMPLEELYSRAQAEHKRSMSVLKNILNVQLPPAAQSLEIAMRDHSELNALMKKVNLKPGTSQFSDTLASAISGLGTAASVANRVHKALKAAGLSVQEYLSSSGFEDLEKKLDQRVESGKVPKEELAKFLTAVADLRASFSERKNPQFEQSLESMGDAMGGDAMGGADDDVKSPVMRRLEKSKSENEIIIKDFARRLARHYDEFLTSVKAIGPLLGKEIKLTDHTDALRNAIDTIRTDSSSMAERLELSLIGRYADAESRRLKEVFMGRMKLIAMSCEDLMGLEMYREASSHFARILAAVTGIEKTIQYYSEVFAKKVGLNAMEPMSYGDSSSTDYITSILPEIASSALSLQEAVNEFIYLYYVAKVRVNLSLTSAELETYGKDYTDLLGDAVAAKVRKLEKAQYGFMKWLEGTEGFDKTTSARDATTGAATWPGTFTPDAQGVANRKEVAKMVQDEYRVKIEFYRAVQAIDLYLKSFTQAVASDPSAVNDIKKLLDGAQVISRWFNQSTGDAIWKAFEQFPSIDDAGVAKDTTTLNAAAGGPIDGADHYYQGVTQKMGAHAGQQKQLGVPEMGIDVVSGATEKLSKVKKEIATACDNFQALKNLINAFARIGDSFGGRELRQAVFMSPAQIYKALMDYLKQSALSINKQTTPAPAGGAGGASLASPAVDQLLTIGTPIAVIADAVSPWQVYFGAIGTDAAGTHGNYVEEDGFFKSTIKAIGAKILTVLGVYDMFERTGPIYELTPVRIIVGGADAPVKPIDAAAELYYRLPRLAEFYYGMFSWDMAAAGQTDVKIALLADFEGVFAGLIRFTFLRTIAQNTGDYSDSEVQTLVAEINQIYLNYKETAGDAVVSHTINEFVKEINRRYGIVKKADHDAFLATMRRSLIGVAIPQSDNTNYAILPGEGDVEVKRRAPSDRFYDRSWEKPGDRDPFKDRPEVGAYQSALEAFRAKLFDKLELAKKLPGFAENTTTEMIKLAQRDMAKGDAQSQMDLAAKLIRSDQFIGDASKQFIFHETVVVGLNMLSAIEAVLRRFSMRMQAMDTQAIESGIMQALFAQLKGGSLGVGAGGAWGAQTLVNLQDLLNQEDLKTSSNKSAPENFGVLVAEFLLNSENSSYYNVAAVATPYRGRSGLEFDVDSSDAWAFAQQAFDAAVAWPAAGVLGDFNIGDKKFASVLTGAQFKTAYGDNCPLTDAECDAAATLLRKMRMFARLITDYQKIMKVFLEEVFALTSSSGGLIDVSISQDGMRLGYTKLQDTVERILADVKSQMDALRPSLTKATIERYDGRSADQSKIPVGSIQWVEKELMDKFFRNQDLYMDPMDPARTLTMEGVSKKVRDVYSGLVREHLTVLSQTRPDIQAAAPGTFPDDLSTLSAEQKASRREWYGSTIAGLIYYDATLIDSGIDQGDGAIAGGTAWGPVALANTLSGLIASQRPIDNGPVLVSAVLPPVPLIKTAKTGALPAPALRQPIYDATAVTTAAETRSLMFSYNQVIARFLQTFMDSAAGSRIYLNLINAFANGTASNSVFNPTSGAFPDLGLSAVSFGLRGDPMPGAVLLQSLGWVLQRLIRDSNPTTQVSDHLIATLTDVPLYMKESLRANLPSFVHLFELLAQKADFYKQVIQKTQVDLTRQNCARAAAAGLAVAADTRIYTWTSGRGAAGGAVAAGKQYPGGLAALSKALYPLGASAAGMANIATERDDSSKMRTRISAVIDGVSSGAVALLNSSSETLRELADDPMFFETGEGSIQQYTARIGKAPLMPLSLMLYYLRDNIENADVTQLANYLMTPITLPGVNSSAFVVYQTGQRASRVLVGQPYQPASVLYPGHMMGVPAFRMLYGVRGLLASKGPVNYDHLPGVRSILEIYNSSVSGRSSISPEVYLASTQNLVSAMRWITDARCFKALVSPYVGPDRIGVVRSQYLNAASALRPIMLPSVLVVPSGVADLADAQAIINGAEASIQHPYWSSTKNALIDQFRQINLPADSAKAITSLTIIPPTAAQADQFGPNEAYAIRLSNSLERVLQVVESSDQTSELQMIGSTIQTKRNPMAQGQVSGALSGRALEQINNLLEMNIIPINVHALMRGIPLANVYNYEMSFDQFAAQILGEDLKSTANPRNASQMLLKMLQDPYCAVSAEQYGSDVTSIGSAGLVHRIFRGDNGIGMGRPKFLSDQLFNKALFGSVYQSRHDWDEAGPATGIGAARGRGAMTITIADTATLSRFIVGYLNGGGAVTSAAIRAAAAALPPPVLNAANLLTDDAAALVALAALAALGAAPNEAAIMPIVSQFVAAHSQSQILPARAHVGGRSKTLTWLSEEDRAQALDFAAIKKVKLADIATKARLEEIGRLRFDTRFVRNMFFVTNVMRLVRMKLARELSHSRSVLRASHMAVAAGVTEYGSDPFSPNEVYASKDKAGVTRWNDSGDL